MGKRDKSQKYMLEIRSIRVKYDSKFINSFDKVNKENFYVIKNEERG